MRTELRALERELLPEMIRIALLDAAEQFAWEWRLAAIRGAPSPDDSYLKTLVHGVGVDPPTLQRACGYVRTCISSGTRVKDKELQRILLDWVFEPVRRTQ
jgi:hypothetical protein